MNIPLHQITVKGYFSILIKYLQFLSTIIPCTFMCINDIENSSILSKQSQQERQGAFR